VRAVLVIVAGALALAGCTSSGPGPSVTTTIDRTTTKTHTRHVSGPSYIPKPARSVGLLPPDAKPPKGEVRKSCPYIKAGLDSEPTRAPNIADLEGSRVGQVTVLTRLHPVGCRFYFSYGYLGYQAIADIVPRTFNSRLAARNAMILTARAGSHAESYPNFVKGVDGVRYQTKFYGPDGKHDWAFVFAKGKVMVVVHTEQTNASLNGQAIAEAIVGKF
jgi:hypothetical protein